LAKSGVIPSSVRTVHYSTEHTAQEDHGVHEWQLVRRPKWWRREKHRHSNSPFDTVNLQKHQGQLKFKAKLSGRCFNYLSTSHHRAQCRDPTVYWKCKKIGHISSSCASSLSKPCRVKGLAKGLPLIHLLIPPFLLPCTLALHKLKPWITVDPLEGESPAPAPTLLTRPAP
jgi:hypothetical protein